MAVKVTPASELEGTAMLKHSDFPEHPDVMVSSTYLDLTAHREAACDALLRLGLFPVGMEYDSAKAGKDVIASSLDMVAKAHAYIGIIGHRYGGVPQDAERNPDGLSITELEYRAALRRGIPVYMFLMSEEHAVKRQDVEPVEAYQAKLRAFKEDVLARSVCPTFSSVEELRSCVLQSMSEFKAQLAGRAEPSRREAHHILVEPPHLLAIPNFISGHKFVGRREELNWLDEWAASDDPLLVIEAIGGTGKSTLAWQWLDGQAGGAREGFAGRLWYSFYEGGADMASFAAHAFTYLTGQPLWRFRGMKTAELAGLLVAALRRKRFLLVLDGLERVLVAYHRLDASQTRDDKVGSGKDDRACIKPADGDLLRQLVAARPSKILITTRLLPTALLNKSGQLLPGAGHRILGGLHPDDALTMIRSVGVTGDAQAIRRYLTENFDNHPQIVGVVAGLVKDYVREPGNFDRWAADPQAGAALHLSQLNLVQRQTHILAAALEGLDPGVRQVLSRIAALGSAVRFETVEALNPYLPPPPKLSEEAQSRLDEAAAQLKVAELRVERITSEDWDWAGTAARAGAEAEIDELRAQVTALEAARAAEERPLEEYHESEDFREALPRLIAALRELEQRGLLQWDRQKNTYDLHPVVRGYAFDALEQPERVDICGLIADHFRSRPPDRYKNVETLADVQQSMDIFRALVQAGRFGEALGFYRGDFANALSYSIEAYHEILALLKPLFPEGFSRPPADRRHNDQSYLLNNAAVALIMLGRLREARRTLTAMLRLNLDTNNRDHLHVCLANLGETLRDENKLALAHAAFEQALALARAMDSSGLMARDQWHLMTTYRITGQLGKARAAYDEFRRLRRPMSRGLYRDGDAEGELCWLSFYEGVLTEKELARAEKVARDGNNRTVLRGLLRLRGELALNKRGFLGRNKRGDPAQAVTAFEGAIEMALAVGLPAGSSEARLALAKARAGEPGAARDICERLHESEKPPHVELGPAYLELGDYGRARQHALAGYLESWADGPPYSRWWELEQCKAVLKSLREPAPQRPKFNPEAVEQLPYMTEIRQFIKELGSMKIGRR
jgi:tetratricopeptide (TPR) repeat protein